MKTRYQELNLIKFKKTSSLKKLLAEIDDLVNHIENQELNLYLKKVIDYSFEANKFFNDSEPWSLKKTDKEKMNLILNIISEQIKNISILLSPIIPIATNKALDVLNIPKSERNILGIKKENIFDYEKKLNRHDILFKKVDI